MMQDIKIKTPEVKAVVELIIPVEFSVCGQKHAETMRVTLNSEDPSLEDFFTEGNRLDFQFTGKELLKIKSINKMIKKFITDKEKELYRECMD
jgi:hypothetical protein